MVSSEARTIVITSTSREAGNTAEREKGKESERRATMLHGYLSHSWGRGGEGRGGEGRGGERREGRGGRGGEAREGRGGEGREGEGRGGRGGKGREGRGGEGGEGRQLQQQLCTWQGRCYVRESQVYFLW